LIAPNACFSQISFEYIQRFTCARWIAAFQFHLGDALVLNVDHTSQFVNAIIEFKKKT
jgi:hypothetical protein